MKRALEEYRVIGIRTNIPFHQHLLQTPDFIAGDFNTQYVQDELPPLITAQQDKTLSEIAALAAVLAAHHQDQREALEIKSSQRDGSNWKWVSRWELTKE
jgi:acetyl/propionyl-CoA carboxylase alpha subunit